MTGHSAAAGRKRDRTGKAVAGMGQGQGLGAQGGAAAHPQGRFCILGDRAAAGARNQIARYGGLTDLYARCIERHVTVTADVAQQCQHTTSGQTEVGTGTDGGTGKAQCVDIGQRDAGGRHHGHRAGEVIARIAQGYSVAGGIDAGASTRRDGAAASDRPCRCEGQITACVDDP